MAYLKNGLLTHSSIKNLKSWFYVLRLYVHDRWPLIHYIECVQIEAKVLVRVIIEVYSS